MIKTENLGQLMPVRFFGLFGQHHGLELELKKKLAKSIKKDIFFDYKNRCYEIQSFSLKRGEYWEIQTAPRGPLYYKNTL